MRIRKMELRDYEAVYELWLHTDGMGLNDLDDSPEGIGRFLTRNPSTCFVAEKHGKLLGAIMAGHDGRRGYIYHTAVSRESRGKGIGKLLVEAVMEAFHREGIHKAALVVFSRNVSGNAFWERMGFTERTDLTYRNRSLSELVRIDTDDLTFGHIRGRTAGSSDRP